MVIFHEAQSAKVWCHVGESCLGAAEHKSRNAKWEKLIFFEVHLGARRVQTSSPLIRAFSHQMPKRISPSRKQVQICLWFFHPTQQSADKSLIFARFSRCLPAAWSDDWWEITFASVAEAEGKINLIYTDARRRREREKLFHSNCSFMENFFENAWICSAIRRSGAFWK